MRVGVPLLDPKPLHDKWGKRWSKRTELKFMGQQYDTNIWHGEPLWASMAIAEGTGPGWLDTIINYQEIRKGLWDSKFYGQPLREFAARWRYRPLNRETMQCIIDPKSRPNILRPFPDARTTPDRYHMAIWRWAWRGLDPTLRHMSPVYRELLKGRVRYKSRLDQDGC